MPPSYHDPILVLTADPQVNSLVETLLQPEGFNVRVLGQIAEARKALNEGLPRLVILGEKLPDGSGLAFARELSDITPTTPVLLFVYQESTAVLKQAIQAGVLDTFFLPIRGEDLLKLVRNALAIGDRRRGWMQKETRIATANLRSQMSDLEMLGQLSRSITSQLDIDSVLSTVMDTAVSLTGAEESSLLLVDEATGELYLRASRNFDKSKEQGTEFRMGIEDTVAGTVIRTGQPILLDEENLKKIKTDYLVYSLVYVPLKTHDKPIGVLGVDNRNLKKPFNDYHVRLLSAVADFAAIAIQNARAFSNTDTERARLESILAKVQDGVIILDAENKVIFINQGARDALSLDNSDLVNLPAETALKNSQIKDLLERNGSRAEINLEEGRAMDAQLTPISDVGTVITLHDISMFKELDRAKSDFVNTVSHDLRTPLTTILGYVELVERVGPVTDLQREYIRHVQMSVHNITNLVNDLLNLGRIEAGFDKHKEIVHIDQLIGEACETLKDQLAYKGHRLSVEIPPNLPPVWGNPILLSQVVDNLLGNSIKYTPPGGQIFIRAEVESDQMILKFKDTGVGIPPMDLPFIFDKFFRASNAAGEAAGTGLGLAIVKSIVENHYGRIWVDSVLSQGSTFNVVLPLYEGQEEEK
ncbi:MAG: GAF domain-containing protein [Leptolinea sp.]|jgi:two-component system NtrC family sensor kinase|nr:GAF domain-containing protein [Leptolinea sp.]